MYMYLSSLCFISFIYVFALNCYYYYYAKILIFGNYQNRSNVSIPFHRKYIQNMSRNKRKRYSEFEKKKY